MARIIFCQKFKKEAEGLDFPPYPGAVGNKIYENISKEAWEQWLNRQTMFINEYRLNLSEAKSRSFLASEMEKFLFSGESKAPEGYIPPENRQNNS